MAAPMKFRSCGKIFDKVKFLRGCSFQAAPKPKETLRQRIYRSIDGYYQDYKAVAIDSKNDIKNHPFKTTCYLMGFGILTLFHKTVPDEDSFREKLRESAHELALVSKLIRNPESDEFIRDIVRYENCDQLRYINLVLFSIIWHSDFGKGVDTYEAHCPHLKPKWLEYRDRIVDVGVLGQWVWIQQYMHDFDVNPEEWAEKGS